jgi:hypothetical protein
MKRGVGVVGGLALFFVLPASCTSGGGTSDAGSDALAPTTCTTNADCTNGTECLYPTSAGCSATLHCLPPPNAGACKAAPWCACDGTSVSTCSTGASKPVDHMGPCAVEAATCASGLSCEQCDVSGYAPTPMARVLSAPGACSPSAITSAVSSCFATTATGQTCAAWENAEAQSDAGACVTCVLTNKSASAWGAMFCLGGVCKFNNGGCIDLLLGTAAQETSAGGAGSCGDLFYAREGCEEYACDSCSQSGALGSTDFDKCSTAARANECSTYGQPIASTTGVCAALDGDAGPSASRCFPTSDSDVAAYLNVFCGTGP